MAGFVILAFDAPTKRGLSISAPCAEQRRRVDMRQRVLFGGRKAFGTTWDHEAERSHEGRTFGVESPPRDLKCKGQVQLVEV